MRKIAILFRFIIVPLFLAFLSFNQANSQQWPYSVRVSVNNNPKNNPILEEFKKPSSLRIMNLTEVIFMLDVMSSVCPPIRFGGISYKEIREELKTYQQQEIEAAWIDVKMRFPQFSAESAAQICAGAESLVGRNGVVMRGVVESVGDWKKSFIPNPYGLIPAHNRIPRLDGAEQYSILKSIER